jgi:hypothetical protein
MSITVERIFQIPYWDEFARHKVVDFWSRRRIKFSETSSHTLVGTRGSWLGNLISYDMSKLKSELMITVSPANELRCRLKINTLMQIITEYNKAWWNLEMESFESYLLETDEQEERWERFSANNKKAAIVWTLSSGMVGHKIPPEEKP